MISELTGAAHLSNGGFRVASAHGARAIVVAAPYNEVGGLLAAGVPGQVHVDLGPHDLQPRRLDRGEQPVPPAGAVPLEHVPLRAHEQASVTHGQHRAPRRAVEEDGATKEGEHLRLHLHHGRAGDVRDGEVAPRHADRLGHRERRGLRRAEPRVHHHDRRRSRCCCRCSHPFSF
jgi:hypothetical protein